MSVSTIRLWLSSLWLVYAMHLRRVRLLSHLQGHMICRRRVSYFTQGRIATTLQLRGQVFGRGADCHACHLSIRRGKLNFINRACSNSLQSTRQLSFDDRTSFLGRSCEIARKIDNIAPHHPIRTTIHPILFLLATIIAALISAELIAERATDCLGAKPCSVILNRQTVSKTQDCTYCERGGIHVYTHLSWRTGNPQRCVVPQP